MMKRNRYKPNIPPKGGRTCATSTSTDSKATKTTTVNLTQTEKERESVSEKSPQNAKTTDTKGKADDPDPDSHTKSDSQKNITSNDIDIDSSTKNGPPSKTLSQSGSKPLLRRSRIKPVVKTASRPRGSSIAKDKQDKVVAEDVLTDEGTLELAQAFEVCAQNVDSEAPFIPPRVKAATPPSVLRESTNIVNVNQTVLRNDTSEESAVPEISSPAPRQLETPVTETTGRARTAAKTRAAKSKATSSAATTSSTTTKTLTLKSGITTATGTAATTKAEARLSTVKAQTTTTATVTAKAAITKPATTVPATSTTASAETTKAIATVTTTATATATTCTSFGKSISSVTTTERTAICSVASSTTATSSSSLIGRRKRTLPNLAGASRRRQLPSVSKDKEKVSSQAETVSQQQSDHSSVPISSDISSSDPTVPSKRPRLDSSECERILPLDTQPVCHDNVAAEQVVTETEQMEEEIVEQPPKKAEEKKRKHSKVQKPKEPVDHSKMTLQDLIYYNPKDNPMKSSVKAKKKRGEKAENRNVSDNLSEVNSPETSAPDPPANKIDLPNMHEGGASDHDMENEEGGEEASLAPKVKIAEDGTIILDEDSLVIRSPPRKTLEDSEIVYEDCNAVNYAAYLKHRKIGKWKFEETLKFYKALSQVGSDFSLMLPLFPTRTRKELKAKFKREEKVNRSLVDKALTHHIPLDLEEYAAGSAAASAKKIDETDENKSDNKEEKKKMANSKTSEGPHKKRASTPLTPE